MCRGQRAAVLMNSELVLVGRDDESLCRVNLEKFRLNRWVVLQMHRKVSPNWGPDA